jgi:hypothetical protein
MISRLIGLNLFQGHQFTMAKPTQPQGLKQLHHTAFFTALLTLTTCHQTDPTGIPTKDFHQQTAFAVRPVMQDKGSTKLHDAPLQIVLIAEVFKHAFVV